MSYSGQTNELKNIIQYALRNKILLIGIVSKKDSLLYKSADIKLLIPQVKESEGIVPTSSTTAQLALGDALAIASMRYKKFDKSDFKKIHPAGSLGAQLKTVEDVMLSGDKIPFVKENTKMKDALKRGERVELRDLFTIEPRIQKARISRNPKTNEKVNTPEKKSILFKMSKEWANKVNE